MLPSYQVTMIPSYQVTTLPKLTSNHVTKIPSYQVTTLPKLTSYHVTKIPSYQVSKLPSYQVNHSQGDCWRKKTFRKNGMRGHTDTTTQTTNKHCGLQTESAQLDDSPQILWPNFSLNLKSSKCSQGKLMSLAKGYLINIATFASFFCFNLIIK